MYYKIARLPTFKKFNINSIIDDESKKLIKLCLRNLNLWLSKNTSVISCAKNASPHSKYLKMQKIILEELQR